MSSIQPVALDPSGLFDASPNPYLVLDRRLHIVGANKAYLAGVKRELSDIVGRWAWDAFPTDPETLRQAIASFERVIRTKQPDTMPLLRFDVPRPASDGGGMEDRYWSITHSPVLDAAGEVETVLQHPIWALGPFTCHGVTPRRPLPRCWVGPPPGAARRSTGRPTRRTIARWHRAGQVGCPPAASPRLLVEALSILGGVSTTPYPSRAPSRSWSQMSRGGFQP